MFLAYVLASLARSGWQCSVLRYVADDVVNSSNLTVIDCYNHSLLFMPDTLVDTQNCEQRRRINVLDIDCVVLTHEHEQ